MSLIHCPECGKTVSDKADVCQFCRYPIREYVSNREMLNANLMVEIQINFDYYPPLVIFDRASLKVLYEGSNPIARFNINKPTDIGMCWGYGRPSRWGHPHGIVIPKHKYKTKNGLFGGIHIKQID